MKLIISFALLCGFAGFAFAKDLKPLSGLGKDYAPPYPFERCAGLYQAMMEWVGETRMGSEAMATIDTARLSLLLFSALLRQQHAGGTIEQQLDNSVRDVTNIANLYTARFQANYASSGHSFAEDELVRSDLQICQAISEEFVNLLKN